MHCQFEWSGPASRARFKCEGRSLEPTTMRSLNVTLGGLHRSAAAPRAERGARRQGEAAVGGEREAGARQRAHLLQRVRAVHDGGGEGQSEPHQDVQSGPLRGLPPRVEEFADPLLGGVERDPSDDETVHTLSFRL